METRKRLKHKRLPQYRKIVEKRDKALFLFCLRALFLSFFPTTFLYQGSFLCVLVSSLLPFLFHHHPYMDRFLYKFFFNPSSHSSAPNLLVYVVASHNGLQAYVALFPPPLISAPSRDTTHVLALCACVDQLGQSAIHENFICKMRLQQQKKVQTLSLTKNCTDL